MDKPEYPRISASSRSSILGTFLRQRSQLRGRILTVIFLVTFSLFIHGVVPANATYQAHNPIVINGNADFNSSNGVTGGTGTASDPFIIQGWDITTSSRVPGIIVSNTDAYFQILNVYVHSTGYPAYGINMTNASNGAVKDSTISLDWWSITLNSSTNIIISHDSVNFLTIAFSRDITVSESGLQRYSFVQMRSSDNVMLVGNVFEEFQIVDSTRVTMENNTVSGDVEIKDSSLEQFDSLAIAPDNTAHGRPLSLYKDCSNLTLDSAKVSGEVIVVNCDGVTIGNLALRSNLVFDNCCVVQLAFVNNAVMTNINSTGPIRVTNSSAIEISHNRVAGVTIDSTVAAKVSSNDSPIIVANSANVSLLGNQSHWPVAGDDPYLYGGYGKCSVCIVNSLNVSLSGSNLPGCDCTSVRIQNSEHVKVSADIIGGDRPVELFNSGFVEISDNHIAGGGVGAMIMDSCSNVSIQRNQMHLSAGYARAGVAVTMCDNVSISGNDITPPIGWGGFGDLIHVSLSNNITIAGNNFFNSTTAIKVSDSSLLTITANNIRSNARGVVLNNTDNSRIFHNNFLSNTVQAIDTYSIQNTWDNGYPSGGNYWSDYAGVDNCSGPNQDVCTGPDGIGDTPYRFNNNQDNYPLMKPY